MIRRSAWWDSHAAAVVARYPLAAEDWDQHRDAVSSGFYSVHLRSSDPKPALAQDCNFADIPEEPLSPEFEETLF